MAAVEEGTRMTRCFGDSGPCMGETRCLTHDLWTALGAQIEGFLASVSLRDVLEGIPQRAIVTGAPKPAMTTMEGSPQ